MSSLACVVEAEQRHIRNEPFRAFRLTPSLFDVYGQRQIYQCGTRGPERPHGPRLELALVGHVSDLVREPVRDRLCEFARSLIDDLQIVVLEVVSDARDLLCIGFEDFRERVVMTLAWDNEISAGDNERLLDHLKQCPKCRKALARMCKFYSLLDEGFARALKKMGEES